MLLYATVVLVLGWGHTLWRIQDDRSVTLQASHKQLATLSKALASQLQAMAADGVGAARAAANVLRKQPGRFDPQQVLDSMLTGGPYVRALFLVEGSQTVIAVARDENLTRTDMPWLRELQTSTADVWVGPVQVRQPDQQLLLPIARRTVGPPGVEYWAGAMLRISDLETVYADLLESRATVSIIHEGHLLAQIPRGDVSRVNMDLTATRIYKSFSDAPRQPITLMVGPHPVTGVPRQFAGVRLGDLPLTSSAGRDISDALAPWRVRTASSLAFILGATVVIYGLAIALQRLLNRRFMTLQKSEERFQLAAAATHDGLFEWHPGTDGVYFTPRALELLRLPAERDTLDLDELRQLVHPDDLQPVTTALRRHIEEQLRLDVEARLRVGEVFRWFRVRGQAVWNERGEAKRLAGAIGDIDDAVQAQAAIAASRQAELQAKESLARELLVAQEQERKRLASELHDGIGQNLSLLRNRAVMLQRAGLPEPAVPHIQTMLALATESIEDLRRVAQNLRPLHLEELGIVTALRALLERVGKGSELKVHSRLEDIDDVIHGTAAMHVYRIAQEAINNVLKHARAHNLWFEAIRDIDCVLVRIGDDGRGMNARPRTTSGLGMLSIRERSSILRASLDIRSDEGAGMYITLRIPIDAGEAPAQILMMGGIHD
jgi:two-component system sensor histidine kinase UhpB